MSHIMKINRRRKYGNLERRIQRIKDAFQIEHFQLNKKPVANLDEKLTTNVPANNNSKND